MDFEVIINKTTVEVVPKWKSGFLNIWKDKPNLTNINPAFQELNLALGDLAALEEEKPGSALVYDDRIVLSHEAVSRLESRTAKIFNLPPFPDLTLVTNVKGIVGNRNFQLNYTWKKNGVPVIVKRTGAILETSEGTRRLPWAIFNVIEIADIPLEQEISAQWNALARFRKGLEGIDERAEGTVSLTNFLSGLNVHIASGFSMNPKGGETGLDFEIVAHNERGLDAKLTGEDPEVVSKKIRERGALPAYRLTSGSFLIVEETARPILNILSQMQKSKPKEKEAFVRNPLPFIAEAIEVELEKEGKFEGLDDITRQDVLEREMDAFVEISGYADRVLGIGDFIAPEIDFDEGSGIKWLPEIFEDKTKEFLNEMPLKELENLKTQISNSLEAGEKEFFIDDTKVHINDTIIEALDQEIRNRTKPKNQSEDLPENDDIKNPPQILLPSENFEELGFFSDIQPRFAEKGHELPKGLRSTLYPYQLEGLNWQQNAWKYGLPGILNADEQGLGKTIQTIAFLDWLKEQLGKGFGPVKGPILIVSPTTLLKNWEKEVTQHLKDLNNWTLFRLYGNGLSELKKKRLRGYETDDATEHLNLSLIQEAIEENRSHRFWLITTYKTLTNYQHSIGKIPFSAIVFDEIQNLKNPGTLGAKAAKAMNGDFKIGLTGTPVENTVKELWAIMDQLVPGFLGTLKEFSSDYNIKDVDPDVLAGLHKKVFATKGDRPPVALRRMKEKVATHLPKKTCFLHPSKMPNIQASVYEKARKLLTPGNIGGALKVLRWIRDVSLHPDIGMTEGFEDASARLIIGLKIIDKIYEEKKRVLVFIESRQMQHRFIALAKGRYKLNQIELINGLTPINKRQSIVDRFQGYMDSNQFNLLILSPKAAGTGLTLTAATHVIHLSRWWNPAVEEQCNDRVHRVGQNHPVSVHVPLAIHPHYGLGSFDCQLQLLMARKSRLARDTLFPRGEWEEDENLLQKGILDDQHVPNSSMTTVMNSLFSQMGIDGVNEPDGAYRMNI